MAAVRNLLRTATICYNPTPVLLVRERMREISISINRKLLMFFSGKNWHFYFEKAAISPMFPYMIMFIQPKESNIGVYKLDLGVLA